MTQTNLRNLPAILNALDDAYPDSECALHFNNVYELISAVILSAQCTDKMVNQVTPALFERYPSVHDLAEANLAELERIIYRTGFYRNKSKHLKGMAQKVVDQFNGEIPDNLPDLMSLPGVARKTANVVMNVWHNEASGIVVDTHVGRISRLLGLASGKSADKIASELEAVVPREHWIRFSMQLIDHGRAVCIARRPQCAECQLRSLCPSALPSEDTL